MVQKILQSDCHVISTFRTKQDYVISDKNGKMIPEKVGLKPVTKDGMDYEFTIVMDIDINHNATCSKDRTQLFTAGMPFKISQQTGEKINQWCNDVPIATVGSNGVVQDSSLHVAASSVEEMVAEIKDLDDLVILWGKVDHTQEHYDVFKKRKNLLQKKGGIPMDNLDSPFYDLVVVEPVLKPTISSLGPIEALTSIVCWIGV